MSAVVPSGSVTSVATVLALIRVRLVRQTACAPVGPPAGARPLFLPLPVTRSGIVPRRHHRRVGPRATEDQDHGQPRQPQPCVPHGPAAERRRWPGADGTCHQGVHQGPPARAGASGGRSRPRDPGRDRSPGAPVRRRARSSSWSGCPRVSTPSRRPATANEPGVDVIECDVHRFRGRQSAAAASAGTSTLLRLPGQCAPILRRRPRPFGLLALVEPVPEDQAVAVSSDRGAPASSARTRQARLPPRWFIVSFWHGHRALLRVTRGRFGLWRPKPGKWGTLRLTTTGRRTGRTRQVVVGYVEDGPNLVTMAMNGWGEAEPAWWLNLQDHPVAIAQTRDGTREVQCAPRAGRRARAAVVPLGRDRQEPRRLRRPAANRDRRRRPRAARRRRARNLTLPAVRIAAVGRGLRTSTHEPDANPPLGRQQALLPECVPGMQEGVRLDC